MTIINSMDVPTYLMMLLIALGLDVYSLIKYRKVKAPWKVLLYGSPVILIVLAINRVIEEYAPNTFYVKSALLQHSYPVEYFLLQ